MAHMTTNTECRKNIKESILLPLNQIGNNGVMGNFGGYWAGTYVLPAVEGNMPCSLLHKTLSCFHISEVYETMTNQPLRLSCISPYLDVLWGRPCFPDVVKTQPTAIDSIVIFRHQTVFVMSGQETLS